MQLTTMESLLTHLLKCPRHDLSMVDFCYSPLVEDILDIEDIIDDLQENNNLNLNSLLFYTYVNVRQAICEEALELITNKEELSNKFCNEEVEEILNHTDYLTGMISAEAEIEPWTNYQDSSINGDLQDIINDDKPCKENALLLIEFYMNEN